MDNGFNNLYEFADCRFDGNKGKLWRNGELILLSPKASELLNLLLEKNGEYVSKEEIFEKVWAETFVEDGVLTQNIYTLRKALGTDGDGQSLIENKTRLGYRIMISVNRIEQTNGNQVENLLAPHSENVQIEKPKRNLAKAALIFGAVLLIAAGFVGWRFFRPTIIAFFRQPIEKVKFSQLTNTGNISNAALSPDGNFLAFARGGKIFLKDLAISREIPLEIPNASDAGFLQFSADGNFIYFRTNKNTYSSAKILRTSRFGGDSVAVAENSYAVFSVSPDNKFLAYYSFAESEITARLRIKNLETKEEKQIFEPIFPANFCSACAPAWSPDGKKIIHINQWINSQQGQLFLIDVEKDTWEEVKLPRFRRFGQAAWFPDGKSFLISASEDGRYFHLWKVFYPELDAQALTVGLNSYEKPIISADGKKILALQLVENANLFVADAENLNEQKPLTNGNTNRFGQMSLIWIDDRKILFSSQPESDTAENLWLTDVDGSSPKKITNETKFLANTPSSDGKFIYYNINRNRVGSINRIAVNGENLTELTNETDGHRRSPQVTADGNWLYYVFFNANGSKIMRRNLIEGKEEIFLENENVQCGLFLSLSSDGKYLGCFNARKNQALPSEKYNAEVAVISTENKHDIRFIAVNGNRRPLNFSPDGKAIEFTVNVENGTQIMRQGFDEKEPKPILQMPKTFIFNFAWSKDGKKIAISQGQQSRDAVLLTEFER